MAFHFQGLTENLEEVLPKTLQLVSNLQVDLKIVEGEKRLMWLEALSLYEDPLWLMKALVEAKLFEKTGYAHPPIGWLETVEKLSLEDATLFQQNHFIAPNMAIVALIQDKKMLTVLREVASGLPNDRKVSAKLMSLPTHHLSPQLEAILRQRLNRLRESFWGVGWRIKLDAKEKIALDAAVLHLRQLVLPHLLGKIGVVQEWSLVANQIKGEVALTFAAHLKSHEELVEHSLFSSLKQLAQKGVMEREVDWLKRILKLEHLRTFNEPMRFVRELGLAWAIYDDPTIFERYGENLESLTTEDLRGIFLRLISTEPVIVAVRR